MKLRNITLGMLTASSLVLAGGSVAQPQPATPASPGSPASPASPGAVTTPPAPAAASQDAGESKLDGADEDFLEKAAHAGFAEVEGAKMAQEKASNPEVKAFADQMMKDHTKVNEELAALAKQKGYTPPTGPALMQTAKLKALGLTDESFDRNYMSQMGVSAHEDTVELFRDASQNAKDPDVKAFATKTLPSLEKHLEMARTLHQKVGGDKEEGAKGAAQQPSTAK